MFQRTFKFKLYTLINVIDNKSVGERKCQNEMGNDISLVPIPCEQDSTIQDANLEDEAVAEKDRLVRNYSTLIPVRRRPT